VKIVRKPSSGLLPTPVVQLSVAELDAMDSVEGEHWSLGARLGGYGQAARAAKAAGRKG